MTFAQCTESSHRSTSSAREQQRDQQHNATDETATMSSNGPEQNPPINLSVPLPHVSSSGYSHTTKDVSTQTSSPKLEDCVQHMSSDRPAQANRKTPSPSKVRKALPIRFVEYADQVRLQRHFEGRRRLLQGRKRILQKTIALSARLHRLSSWVRDGLVEISQSFDGGDDFIHVFQHMQDLVDSSYSQWNHELHTLDSLESVDSTGGSFIDEASPLPKLPDGVRHEFLALLSSFRSDPKFLVERFRTLSFPQIQALYTNPRFQSHQEESLASRKSYAQRKLRGYSKSLKECATCLERSNPLAFLLFNIYGTHHSHTAPENQLRLSTWSTVCAELFMNQPAACDALLPELLGSFASIYEWRARGRVELFLMELLQKGASLLDAAKSNQSSRLRLSDFVNTQPAREFFEEAIVDLFDSLVSCDGGLPFGAAQFASAVAGKLSTVEQQSVFRGVVFTWFLHNFLRVAIVYPENEDMLLKFHISEEARTYILVPFSEKIKTRIDDWCSGKPGVSVSPRLDLYITLLVNWLDATIVKDPYKDNVCSQQKPNTGITVCASEVVQVLVALSPQAMTGTGSFDLFLSSSASAFQAWFSGANSRFERLHQDLAQILEPGTSPKDIHPCKEQWISLHIDQQGQLSEITDQAVHTSSSAKANDSDLDLAQEAARRMCEENLFDTTSDQNYRSHISSPNSLEEAFKELTHLARVRIDPSSRRYWEAASNTLRNKYPRSSLIHDDSAVLQPLLRTTKRTQAACNDQCTDLETELSDLEDISSKIRTAVSRSIEQFEALRLKFWYSISVTHSEYYIDAKNIANALKNMAITKITSPTSGSVSSVYSGRPSSSQSRTSWMFDRPIEDTIAIMKAPVEHGGPRKLADAQIETTKKWLQRSNIDNFCKGEERIHRFCMQVDTLSKILVGETMTDSPVLWSSTLFVREKSYYDIHAFMTHSAPASTRPVSVMSEILSSKLGSQPIARSNDSTRSMIGEDVRSASRRPSIYGSGPSRINRAFLNPELASSIGSPSRAYSATTAESISSFWSPPPSNSRSLTSMSVHSQSASTFNDLGFNRFTNTAKEKSQFLEKIRRTLLCLLLSDLGCPVWSLGSETDSWLVSSRQSIEIESRLKMRVITGGYVERWRCQDSREISRTGSSNNICRRASMSAKTEQKMGADSDGQSAEGSTMLQDRHLDFLRDLGDLLHDLKQQVDPIEKLKIVEEFYKLSVTDVRSTLRPLPASVSTDLEQLASMTHQLKGLDLQIHSPHICPRDRVQTSTSAGHVRLAEHEIVQQIKLQLTEINPRTLFRDLQYIAAFVPPEMLDKTPKGEAFLHLGLAALAYKDEVCRSMVDVADTLVKESVQGGNSDAQPNMVPARAKDYWMTSAREGNAVAQRELALFYLSHPEDKPIMAPPMALSSKVFKSEMLWHERNVASANRSTLCLALYWMQQAADSGDKVARQKLEEREARDSIQ